MNQSTLIRRPAAMLLLALATFALAAVLAAGARAATTSPSATPTQRGR